MARRGRGGSVVVPAVGTAVEAAVAGEAAAVTTDVAGRATKRAGRAARKAGAAAERTGEDIRRGRGPLTPRAGAAHDRRRAGRRPAARPVRVGRRGRGPRPLGRLPGRAPRRHPDAAQRLLRPWRGVARRIDRIAEALDALERTAEDDASRHFVEETRPRLADLAVAVRASEQMPAPRRRTAHKAIAGELDRVELALLRRLGVGQPET